VTPVSCLSLSADLFKVLKISDRDAEADFWGVGQNLAPPWGMFGKGPLSDLLPPLPLAPFCASIPLPNAIPTTSSTTGEAPLLWPLRTRGLVPRLKRVSNLFILETLFELSDLRHPDKVRELLERQQLVRYRSRGTAGPNLGKYLRYGTGSREHRT
jgi:hypothetical protein